MSEQEFTCSRCNSKLVATNEDVIGSAQYEMGIILERFCTTNNWWRRFFGDVGQQGFRKADGYRYAVKCPECSETAFLYDHLTNERVKDYPIRGE